MLSVMLCLIKFILTELACTQPLHLFVLPAFVKLLQILFSGSRFLVSGSVFLYEKYSACLLYISFMKHSTWCLLYIPLWKVLGVYSIFLYETYMVLALYSSMKSTRCLLLFLYEKYSVFALYSSMKRYLAQEYIDVNFFYSSTCQL